MNGLLVALVCSNITVPSDACNAAILAASMQTGVYQDIERFQSYAQKRVLSSTPDVLVRAAGYGVMAYRFTHGGDVKFYFKIPNLCDRVGVGGTVDMPSMSMNWNF